jgi:type IV secretory pathway component VirB8
MSKNHQPLSAAQLERRQVAQARRKRWDRIWTIVILAILVGLLGLVIAIQISHHL